MGKLVAVVLWLSFASLPALASPLLPAQPREKAAFDATGLGTPAMTLEGNWRVRYGDDPRWAATDYDDSGWALQAADKDSDGALGYKGFLWYRMRVRVPANQRAVGISVVDCVTSYQVFVNGKLAGGYGGMPPHESRYENTKSAFSFDLAPGGQNAEIAIRVWAHGVLSEPGLHAGSVRIGDPAVVAQEAHDYRADVDESAVQFWVVNLSFLLLAFVVLTLYAFQPGHREYLWLAAWQFPTSVAGIISSAGAMALIPIWLQFNVSIPLQFVAIALEVEFYFSFIGVRPNRWIRALQGLVVLTLPLGPFILYGHPSARLFGELVFIPGLELAVIAVVLIAMLTVRFRRGDREAGLLLVPTVLAHLTTILNLVEQAAFSLGWMKSQAHLIPDTHFGDYPFSADTWSSILFFLTILALLLYRFLNVSRRQTSSAAEIEAARQVQQVLLPEESISFPGVTIESEYHPADVVGGDFFQVIPGVDGSLLVVVGDVAGKGMGAAMLVGVIVGTIRTAAAFDDGPAFLLHTLNERLCGRMDGAFVTCIAARLTPGGELTIANAGHLSPYLNGEELATIPELPLGIVAGAAYRVSGFVVAPGDRLTFVSDGVVEATQSDGELFGFDRTRLISHDSARAIAAAARAFGQTDDITVVTLTRSPVALLSV